MPLRAGGQVQPRADAPFSISGCPGLLALCIPITLPLHSLRPHFPSLLASTIPGPFTKLAIFCFHHSSLPCGPRPSSAITPFFRREVPESRLRACLGTQDTVGPSPPLPDLLCGLNISWIHSVLLFLHLPNERMSNGTFASDCTMIL